MRRPLLIALTLVLALPLMAQADDWKSLFDGKTMDGWKGRADLWSVKDEALTGYTKDGKIPGGNSFLVWDGKVGDFELKAKYKIVGGNSGIQYRSKYFGKEDEFHIGGYQADIDGAKNDGYTGILYEERGRGIIGNRGTKTWIEADGTKHELRMLESKDVLKAIKPLEWNDYHITAKANHLVQEINGVTTMELIDWQKDKRAMEGVLALQMHAGMGEMTIQFKDIQVKTLTGCEEVTPEKMPIAKEAKKLK
jgi:Domain of Unknown Function (DUF1080)